MALGRLSVTVGHKGEASTWHDYVMREGIHAPKEGDKERVIIKEHGNMPYWVKDGDEFQSTHPCGVRRGVSSITISL